MPPDSKPPERAQASVPEAQPTTPAKQKKPLYEATDDLKFQWYMERRKGYSSGARESYQRYDQTIATVSAGAIVFSITFLKDIGHTSQSLPWLFASWFAFLVAGGVGLMSLRTSADGDMERLAGLEALKGGDDHTEYEKRGQRLGQLTVLLNTVSLWSFLFGIFLMMIFAYVNVSNLRGSGCPPTETAAPANAASSAPIHDDQRPTKKSSSSPIGKQAAPASTLETSTPPSPSHRAH